MSNRPLSMTAPISATRFWTRQLQQPGHPQSQAIGTPTNCLTNIRDTHYLACDIVGFLNLDRSFPGIGVDDALSSDRLKV